MSNAKQVHHNPLKNKFLEFQLAMDSYNNNSIYRRVNLIISIMIMCLQGFSVINIVMMWQDTTFLSLIITFICAYAVTDFINGLVHLYMDNNANYNSIVGPFIAAFHMHHLKPRYADKHPLKVYFYESGSKFWLVVYLALIIAIPYFFHVAFIMQFFLVSIAILSSCAEVSHYWSHNISEKNIIINFLQNNGILLSKKHHIIHHIDDNKNYAFLNGMSNFLINKIASIFYDGYKNHADKHAKAYSGVQTDNRR